ncbi:NAD+ synthase (glutamine-hydrolyzing) [Parabacteroides sp. PFB2-10]|uniref:NAD(+) synthase n=1 Tax=Parabacteroides sp. PFB2-10 TaxID=1742405 RepID=UPI00247413DB|nr:NAD(+) synthase [Parabacteroides sp. PFB2-10]MDH6314101.1 NAD+ synthase (glutamine-hydrolyzing) [Parabacteroides sp. PFB2-10]
MNYGFVKVAAATPPVRVADCFYNIEQIEVFMRKAAEQGVQAIVFPELSVTAYTCLDLFLQQTLIEEAEKALVQLVENTKDIDMLTFVSLPLRSGNCLVNACVGIQKGRILGVVPKTYLPNGKEFQEKRWFTSATDLQGNTINISGQLYPMSENMLFTAGTVSFCVDICEDLWMPIPPSSRLTMAGATIIVNPSASNEVIGKHQYRKQLVKQQSARCLAGYVYATAGYGESTSDVVFAGSSLIAENGNILAEAKRFQRDGELLISEIDIDHLLHDRMENTNFNKGLTGFERIEVLQVSASLPHTDQPVALTRKINPHPFRPSGEKLSEHCEEILQIQVAGLAKRLEHTQAQTAVIGISGGLDSTLALLVTVMTFDLLQIPRANITGITMPGFGTTGRTYANALSLMRSLGVTIREISIKEATTQHFKDINHDPAVHDVTYENSQARERTQILMDIANQVNGLVIGTGDLSELALGWATYNGDHMSMYNVNVSIPKTLIQSLVVWIAENRADETSRLTLLDIVDTPISPELVPADTEGNLLQKTEDLVGPYELHDFFLYYCMRFGSRPAKIYYLAQLAFDGIYDKATIKKWLHTFYRRFFQQQYKRNCLPDGPKVGNISFSPRSDWRMPSDAASAMWLKEIETLD